MADRPSVAIVGGGFSGLLTASRLLLAADGPRVALIERGPRFGRGAAYATANPRHLLNVRATNMSAFVEQPSHFVDWLEAQGVAAGDRLFVTRDRYGQYLQSILREAAADAASGRLTLEHDAVTRLERQDGRWSLTLAMGRTLAADAVVLALGNLPPPPIPGTDPMLETSGRYVANPWAWRPPRAGHPGEPRVGDVLIIGSGLTAIDVALTINDALPDARILALSRRGLLPRAHGPARSGATDPAPQGSPATMLARARRLAADDWRGTIDTLRPHVQSIWRGWTLAERERALRHLRPWWTVHRHRLAPEVAARIEGFCKSGRLEVAAGAIDSMVLRDDGVEVSWRPRGSRERRIRKVDQVINSTGPRGDMRRSGDSLIAGLLDDGLARADPCRLGLDVDARSRVVAASGDPTDSLFAVGPLTRGQFYEITSVPDIRQQAADCADAIINMLALRGRDLGKTTGGGDRLAADLAAFIDETIAELDVELGSLKFARRVRNAWELRGRRAALGQVALWLDERRAGGQRGDGGPSQADG